jgi:hypothetical protein
MVKLLNRSHDIRISAAPAEVTAHPFSNLAFAIGMSLVQASGCRTELSSGTEAALESIVSDKSVLERAELTVLSKSFDSSDFVALVHHRQSETGIDPTPIDQNGAGAALAMVTTFLTASET